MDDPVTLRALERILSVLVGALCVYLGYRLFLHIPEQREGQGKIEFPGGVSVFVARVGPGVFFALFGAMIVGLSLTKGIAVSRPGGGEQQVYAGLSPGSAGSIPRDLAQERPLVELGVEFLNTLPSLLVKDLGEAERREVGTRRREIKLLLMERVWGPDWGNLEAFRLWVEAGAADPVPAPLSAPARFFRAGQGRSP